MRIATSSLLLPAVQAAIGASGLTALAVAPPAHGKILILSLTGETVADTARWATAAGAKVVGTSTGGSLLVEGRSSALSSEAMRHGSVLIAGRNIECGARAAS